MEYTQQAKIIIVGERQTGKSSLLEKLSNSSNSSKKNKSTAITKPNICKVVTIPHPTIKGKPIYANIFDFGEQELDYKTHQFFFTPSALYIMVIDSRFESPNLNYWLNAITQLGRDYSTNTKIKLLFVINKKEKSTSNVDIHPDLKFYRKFLDTKIFEVDLDENSSSLQSLIDTIKSEILTISINKYQNHKVLEPIRKILNKESQKHPYISFKRLTEIFRLNNIIGEEEHFALSNCLHRLGDIIHYQNEAVLMDLVILNPKWVLTCVHDFLCEPSITKQGGLVSIDSFFQILNKHGYSKIDAQKIWFLLSRYCYDICYQTQKGHLLVPLSLPSFSIDNKLEAKKDSLQFRYQFTLMPNRLIVRLIAQLNKYYDETDIKLYGKKGVFLSMDDLECKVLIREDNKDIPQIIIETIGQDFQRKFALRRVRDVFENVHSDFFQTIPFQEIVPCNCDGCRESLEPQLHKLEDLLKLARKDITLTIPCAESVSVNHISVQKLLEGIYNNDEIKSLVTKNQNMEEKEKKGDTIVNNYNNQTFNNSNVGNASNTTNSQKIDSQNATPREKEVSIPSVITVPKPWFEYHWVKSFGKGLIAGAIMGIIAYTIPLIYPLQLTAITFLLFSLFSINQDKRYRNHRLATRLIGGFLTLSLVLPNIDSFVQIDNPCMKAAIRFSNDANPFVTVSIIGLIGFLILMDAKINK